MSASTLAHDGGVTRCADGLAVEADLLVAAERATRQVRDRLGRSPDLATVFVCHPDPAEAAAVLERAAKLSGATTTLGCSAPGVIGDGRGVELVSAVSVWAAELPGATLRSFHLEVLRTTDSLAVVGMPGTRGDDRVALLLADPYSFPADAFVEQTAEVLPGLPVVGGLGTGLRGAGSTRLMVDGVVHERGAVGVLIGGDVSVVALVSPGCRPVGTPMTVTAAEGNVLLGLAGMPAADKLEQVLAALPPQEQAMVTAGLQLGIAMDEYVDEFSRGDFLVRAVVDADTARRGLVVGDVVQVGRTVQFQVRDAETAAADLGARLSRLAGGGPYAGALLFSCTGRGSAMFRTADHDVSLVRTALGSDAAGAVAGFFAAGEIGPVAGRNHLHGFTASLLAIGGLPD